MTRSVLLDAHDSVRRLLQNTLPLAGTALLLAGIAVIVSRHATMQGAIGMALGAGMLLTTPFVLVSFEVPYKGHVIRFEHHVVFGERLYIDGVRFTSGVLGYRKTLRGVIRSGEGEGDRISAECEAGLTIFSVRIVAETE